METVVTDTPARWATSVILVALAERDLGDIGRMDDGQLKARPQHTCSYAQVKRYITIWPIRLTNLDSAASQPPYSVIMSALVS